MKLCHGTLTRQCTKPWTLNQTSHITHRTARKKPWVTPTLEHPSLLSWSTRHIYWCFSPDQHSFSDSAAALTDMFPQQNSWLHFCHENHHSQTRLLEGNNRKQPHFLYSSRITVFHRIPAAFSSWFHCLLTNNWRGFTLLSWKGTGLSPVFNFTFPAYISFCLKTIWHKNTVQQESLQHFTTLIHGTPCWANSPGKQSSRHECFSDTTCLLPKKLQFSNRCRKAQQQRERLRHFIHSILDNRTLFLHCIHNKCSWKHQVQR